MWVIPERDSVHETAMGKSAKGELMETAQQERETEREQTDSSL